ncbi:MAG: response regulator [Deltaproteobacteria bacterium]|jgi:putative two-component system response regulator|nr:response regulator [Deltaproteobacteria bacterium]
MPKTIFVVDDNDTNLATAEKALADQYRVMTLPSAAAMFELMDELTPDLIVMDIEMPEINGFEALRRLKANPLHAGIPVIFLTSMADASLEVRGFEMGVVDFVTKPFSAPVLQNRIKTHLNIDVLIRERTLQLEQLRNGLVLILADIVESRDKATGGHIERTSEYVRILTSAMLERGTYADEIGGLNPELLASAARLHDVGKIAIPDSVLNRLGSLSLEEFEMIKTHTVAGERIIDKVLARTGDLAFLRNAKLFASCHHERWDGSGYPHGLRGHAIPLQGRILAVADVYDAFLSDRPYKKVFTEEEVIALIVDNAGKMFDPLIVEVFAAVTEQFGEARRNYARKEPVIP